QFLAAEKEQAALAKLKVGEVVAIEGLCKGWLPEKNRYDEREWIYFWACALPAAKDSTGVVGGTTVDAEHGLAEWVLSHGGQVHVKTGEVFRWVNVGDKLPGEWFTVNAVSLSGCKKIQDSDLGRLCAPWQLE